MHKMILNYVGLDREIHRSLLEREERDPIMEDPLTGEYYGSQFLENGVKKIRIIRKEDFLKLRDSNKWLSSNTPNEESKPSNSKGTQEPRGGLFGMLLLPSIICCVAFTVPLQLIKEINELFPPPLVDGLAIMFCLLPAIIVFYKTEDFFAALKWAAGTLVCLILFANIAAAIFGWKGDVVQLVLFYVPVILSLLALFKYSLNEASSS